MRMLRALMLAAIFAGAAVAQDAKTKADFGYATVALALESMRAKSGVKTSMQSGWTVIEDPSTQSLWSFTPPGHSAHPSAVHRKVITEGDGILVQSNVLCEASKPACDAVVAEFNKLDQAVRESLRPKPPANR